MTELDTVGGPAWAYRHRAQIHRDESGSLGFLGSRSHRLVPVATCPVLTEELNLALKPEHPVWRGKKAGRHLVTAGREMVWTTDDPEAVVGLNGVDYWFSPAGFLQTHLKLSERLREWIFATLSKGEPGNLWDLYGGSGFWTQLLSQAGWQATIVEEHRASEAFALRNWPGAVFFGGRVEDFLARQTQAPDWVIADPPRTGLSPQVRGLLAKLTPAHLLLIACSPDTFARDTSSLRARGYEMEYLSLWDFYPQTLHSELVSLWSLER